MATVSPSSKENVPFHGGCVHRVSYNASPSNHLPRVSPSDTSFKLNMDSQPAAKKRKLAPSAPSNSQPSQSSFADVLQRLKDEAGDAKGPSPPIVLPDHPRSQSFRC